MSLWKNKWVLFGIVMLLGVVSDQATKLYSETRLASTTQKWSKPLVLTADADYKDLPTYLTQELTWSNEAEIERVMRFSVDKDERLINPKKPIVKDQEITLKSRRAIVVEGYFDFAYARNPGAAWSFWADQSEEFRKYFFRIASTLALFFIMFMVHRAENGQRRLAWALSLVASGAVGNLIDRVLYGYVIDFVVWHVDDSYWPTFNLADAWISIGVGLMFIEMSIGYRDEMRAGKAAKLEGSGEADSSTTDSSSQTEEVSAGVDAAASQGNDSPERS